MSRFHWPKKKKIFGMNRNFVCEDVVSALWPTYILEKGGLWATIWDKSVVLLGTPLSNTLRTWEKSLGTHKTTHRTWWEHKIKRIISPLPSSPPTPKTDEPSLRQILFPKVIITFLA
jgi:hypothetical protein